uniref:alpha-2-macroglobulin-like n=1 Tax=Semicossyphus pulcher TaxID=241346 RepID=UPI0037E81E65
MDRPGSQMWTWALCVFLSWLSVGQAATGPKYTVTIPAILEAGVETQLCASLLNPNETLALTATLMSQEQNLTVIREITSQPYHFCIKFMVPSGNDEMAKLEVELQGGTFHSKEVRKVLIKSYKPMTFVQTDKPIYLPGQNVNFRVVTIDNKLKPAVGVYDTIQIEDAHSNKIGQWLNETSNGKILQLSYSLNSEAREGTYKVIVSIGEERIYQNFKVEKYVLPKFEVQINTADEMSIAQEEISVEVCAKYTYGQSVPGLIKVELCRPLRLYYSRHDDVDLTPPCFMETKKADMSGCATFNFKMSTFTKMSSKVVQDSLQLKAKVEEEGTGITHEQEKMLSISLVVAKLSFIDTPKIYEKGTDVTGKVKAVHYNDTPIPDLPVYLFEGQRWAATLVQNLTTDSDGVAAFTYSTANSDGEIHLHASDKTQLSSAFHAREEGYYESGSHTMSMIQDLSLDTKAVSFLDVQKKETPLHCDSDEDMTIKYTIVGEAQGSGILVYMVLARGVIIQQGFKEIEIKDTKVTEDEVSFNLIVSPEMAPDVQVVAYAVLPSETVIAHSADFSTEKCFRHKVELEFDPSSAVAGEKNTLQVTALPDSLCGVNVVDKSVLIKEPGKILDADRIFDLLPVTKTSYIPFDIQDEYECLVVRPKRYVLHGEPIEDAYTVLKNVGLKMATNLQIRVPSCLKYGGRKYVHDPHGPVLHAHPPSLERPAGGFGFAKEPMVTFRTFFPETWVWDLVEIGESGSTNVSLTVPDTITTWESEAFCLSSEGFGLAPRKELTAFQPFFLELSLPYSIIRGEMFDLKATVFNYLSSCIMVTVTPHPSLEYTLVPKPGADYTSCLCGNERKTFSWTLTPTALGDLQVLVMAEAVASHLTCNNEIVTLPERGPIDIVRKTLRVKAEGIEEKETSTWLFCPNDETLVEEIDIDLPSNMIDGSGRAVVSVLGDIMGRALNNLDGLLMMPFGCGEQNMVRLAPNVYILQYLENTNQLTPPIREKGVSYTNSGYQRQLNYKNYYGYFTSFGSGQGNTWLTAFVMRSFVQAKNFIYIDPSVIDGAKSWLESQQTDNGCFKQSGKLFNNAMKGGVSDEVTLSAYVTAAFLEMNSTVTESIANSLSCMNETIDDLSNTYATALRAYVFTLAGDMNIRAKLLTHLDIVAVKEGGSIHWTQTATDKSLSVEISSYVLLAILSANPSVQELGYAHRIVRWLSSQQNYYGGFSSTQDTVVALQALALYSTLVFSPEGASSVSVLSPSGQLDFAVNTDNKLLYQEQVLQDMTGKYKVEVKGNACASVQISHHFNIPTPVQNNTLSVDLSTGATCGVLTNRPTMNLKMKCLYSGQESSSNMVILDVRMLSGFTPHPDSLKKLKGEQNVERVEHNDDHVLVYLKELSKGVPISYKLQLIQELLVSDLKPAVVKIYDYYQPSDLDQEEYTYPCVDA